MKRRVPCLLAGVTLALTLAPAPAHAATIPTPDDPVTSEENPRVPEGAAWTEAYFPSSDGSDVELHADVLRPADLGPEEKTPVILSVGSYFAHAGQTGDDGFEGTGPSERFNDLIEGADLMERGYTVVMVDLRGFGGSTGCLDWVGPGEQADIKAAIDWSVSQPWSTGKVGMYGKSYDAVTGLVGNNLGPDGLEAVVAQEPLWDMYNYLFSNGVRRPNYLGTPQAYNSIASIQGMPDDSERYRANAAYELTHPECLADNLTDTQDPDPESDYWQARDLAQQAEGSDVPLLVTQGFIEPNTKPEDMQQYLENHTGVERGWLGPWEHVRGNETGSDGRLRMGREGWFEEVVRFYDEHLKGVEPGVEDPNFLIEDNFGEWRAQDTWPEPDRSVTVRLARGSYVDDGGETASARTLVAEGPDGVWDMENAPDPVQDPQARSRARAAADEDAYYSWSRPVRHDTRITGTPRVLLDTEGEGNVLVRLWDVAPDGTAVMFDEQMSLVQDGEVAFDLKDTDWTLAAGHQLGVGIGTNTSRSWADTPSGETITVSRARLELELQGTSDDVAAQGARSPYLDAYLRAYTTQLESEKGTFPLTVSP
ncbi:CocE/NonD family hydrolase [Auraticoccus monumenti]|uniref:Xaa-Pro dipeptidyl-peptidase C-terminal domain-containing protein n=1 Tax=Auraticoccus monumenti TaxID=675864 RepID=A0A1G6TES5_9ACTN|nr:CocE/NonD family hydrolase [Auraticoccus monumenti]SDD27580.1 hypothetical protein SAMN04489747_0601 [Auraticoccus monumenti]